MEKMEEFQPETTEVMTKLKLIADKSEWFQWRYLLDWLCCIIGILFTALIIHPWATPHSSFHMEGDFSLSYPYTSNTVPGWALAVLMCLPPVLITIYQFVFTRKNLVHNIHHALLGWIEAVTLHYVLSNLIKYACGRKRPDFFSRVELGLDDSEIVNGSLSFPSGHTSGSFTAMTFFFLYICGQAKLFRNGHFFSVVIAGIPLYVATWVAITRVQNFKHNYSDILGGAFLGVIAGLIGYFVNFHSVFSKNADKPKNCKINVLLALDDQCPPLG